jgi:hypothetical protein
MTADTALTQRRTSPDHESYAVAYDHPDLGKIEVGRISEREGNPDWTDKWQWSIGYPTLPARQWKQGTAPTRKEANAEWKRAWPAFRDARSEAEWFDAKAAQEFSAKTIMIYDARKLPGLTADQHEQLRSEMNRPGGAPHWLLEILERRGQ